MPSPSPTPEPARSAEPGATGIEPVVVHSSWRGLIAGFTGSLVLTALGAYGVAAGGALPFGGPILAIGGILLTVMLVDFPVASRFDATGIERRPLLAHRRIAYDKVRFLTRTRSASLAKAMWTGNRPVHAGGLVAVVGRRRYLLADRSESVDEYEQVRDVVHEVAPHLLADDIPPPADTTPTWLYRRRRWRPGEGR